jgi:hypothetical protein
MKSSMNGKSHTGENSGAQGDPQKYRQGTTQMLAQVSQTEPNKKAKEKDYMSHV